MTNQNPEGELGHNVKGDVSEYTLKTAKVRSWDAVEIAIEQGRSGSPTPPGYAKGKDGVFKPDPKTVGIVREAFELRAGGATVAEVRAFLASHGINRSVSGVRKMLTSRLYVGEVHFGGHTPNLEAHPAIIDRELFDRVGRMVVTAGRKSKSERLLARLGILRCGSCGGRMSVSRTGNGYAIYRCANEDCSRQVTIMAEKVEQAVVQAVIEARRSLQGQARGEQQAQEAEDAAAEAQERLRRRSGCWRTSVTRRPPMSAWRCYARTGTASERPLTGWPLPSPRSSPSTLSGSLSMGRSRLSGT